MPLPFAYDWKHPDHAAVYAWRLERLGRIRRAIARECEEKKPFETIPTLLGYYRENPIDLIEDWGITYDPRNVEVGQPALMPFIPYPMQREWMEYALRKWRAQEPAASPKSREVGLSWCATALSAALCILHDGMAIGFGSRVEDLVDKKDSPDSLFYKVRLLVENLPAEFRAGWKRRGDAHMRVSFPTTSSVITGEGGDNIGRGGRQGIFWVDESAFMPNPDAIEASLSMTTNNRHDISSYNGTNNPFYRRCTEGKVEPFTFHWRNDPRKDDAWYAKKCEELPAHIIASEVDMNPAASVDRIVIPPAWVASAIDAHRKLGFTPTGQRRGALDVADEGVDLNAYVGTHGPVIERIEAWAGKGDDIFGTVQRAFMLADQDGADGFEYDADGLGAGVRGDARVINEDRHSRKQSMMLVTPWRGSGKVAFPLKPIPTATPRDPNDKSKARTNEDFFMNAKAQGWYDLRIRFLRTHRAVADKAPFDPDDLISLPSELPGLNKLVLELSQSTFAEDTRSGKILIDKMPNGARSPNMADAVMIRYAPKITRAPGFFDMPDPMQPAPSAPAVTVAPRQLRPRMFR